MKNLNEVINVTYVINNVIECPSSIFTKDDVLSIINQIQLNKAEAEKEIDLADIMALVEDVFSELESETECLDYEPSDFELSLNDAEITVDSCQVDLRQLHKTIKASCEDLKSELKTKLNK